MPAFSAARSTRSSRSRIARSPSFVFVTFVLSSYAAAASASSSSSRLRAATALGCRGSLAQSATTFRNRRISRSRRSAMTSGRFAYSASCRSRASRSTWSLSTLRCCSTGSSRRSVVSGTVSARANRPGRRVEAPRGSRTPCSSRMRRSGRACACTHPPGSGFLRGPAPQRRARRWPGAAVRGLRPRPSRSPRAFPAPRPAARPRAAARVP